MNYKKTMAILAVSLLGVSVNISADEFSKADLKLWESEFQAVVKQGRGAFTDPALGSNGVVCAQCHPNAANTHPETYPKFQKQLGKVVNLWEMVNWCIRNPLQGQPLAADDAKMTALLSYIAFERKGVKLEAGKH